jgi:hypothetical protein
MPEYTKVDPFASFATTCCLCTDPRPVHRDGMCAEFGGKAWTAPTRPKKVRAFSLTPLHKAGPRTPRGNK